MNISQVLTKLKALIYSKSETDSLLGGKANSSHTHTKSQITDFPSYGNTAGTICQGNDARLSDARTPTSHTHTKSQITDFPSLATVAISGSYTDLSNKPTIPTNTNQLTNGAGFITSSGSCNYANSAGSASSATTATTAGAVRTVVDNGSTKNLVYATMANNDYCRISCGGSDDAGYLEIATGDGASEPIYVRQYPWESNSSPRTLTLLDGSGNTQFPGTVTAPTFSGNLNGNCSGTAGGVAWGNVSGKPSTFTPSSHTHTKSQITDFPTIPSKTSQLTNDSGFLTSHQSLANYVTSSKLSTELSGKLDKIDHGYKYITGNGTYSWCKLATITIKSAYINNPISFEVDGRGRLRSTIQIVFASSSEIDPSLSSFTSDVDMNFYIKKVATSKWELYGNYSETWGKFTLYRVTSSLDSSGVVIDTTLSNLSSAPSGATRVSANDLYVGSYRVYVG